MNINCQGPCLLHCYYKNSLLLLVIGFLLGLVFSHYYKNNNKSKNTEIY